PEVQWLYEDNQLHDRARHPECDFNSQTVQPQAPATVGLAFSADEAFEPFSTGPELPYVRGQQNSGSKANEQAV
ncbi:hypothetical protein FD755_018702, partial [Muntiacus reevesi]